MSKVAGDAGDDSTHKISKRMGGKPTASAIGRWKDGAPDGKNVGAFARKYGRPVQEAFVAAGLMTTEEAGDMLASLDEEALLLELLRRVRARKATEQETDGE